MRCGQKDFQAISATAFLKILSILLILSENRFLMQLEGVEELGEIDDADG